MKKKKIWEQYIKKKNDLKKFRRKLTSKEKKKRRNRNNHQKKKQFISKYFKKIFDVPINFSIIDNPKQTIIFFNNLIKEIEEKRKLYRINPNNTKTSLYLIDMSKTEKITIDALIYLLTIIRNTRGTKNVPISWLGNFPKDEEVSKKLRESGFLKYMKTSQQNIINSSNKFQIKYGNSYYYYDDEKKYVDIRTQIIDFSKKHLNVEKTSINFLSTMLIEMITNINDHAYTNYNIFEPMWHIFVEDCTDKISYTFIDNGLGIPTTIKKKLFEKIKENIIKSYDYKYVESAIGGEDNRSETGLLERGNGLPSIYEQYKLNKIQNLVIISNKAYISKEKSYDLENSLNGTLYYWEIKKGGII